MSQRNPETTIDRAKVVARILTDHGYPVTSPDQASLDDVEIERWNACIEIVQALKELPHAE